MLKLTDKNHKMDNLGYEIVNEKNYKESFIMCRIFE